MMWYDKMPEIKSSIGTCYLERKKDSSIVVIYDEEGENVLSIPSEYTDNQIIYIFKIYVAGFLEGKENGIESFKRRVKEMFSI